MMGPLAANEPVTILLVEDNRADIRLIREGLRGNPALRTLQVVRDGEQALAYLRRERPYAKASRPRLIILDLNLPKKDGRQVLDELKRDPALKAIPIVVLTTSGAEDDVLRSYENHANCYLTKPVDLDSFVKTIRQIHDFWLAAVQLPPARGTRP